MFQPQSGIILSLNDGTITFNDGESEKSASIGIDGTGFLELGTTFSVSLIEVQYLGPGAGKGKKNFVKKVWARLFKTNDVVS